VLKHGDGAIDLNPGGQAIEVVLLRAWHLGRFWAGWFLRGLLGHPAPQLAVFGHPATVLLGDGFLLRLVVVMGVTVPPILTVLYALSLMLCQLLLFLTLFFESFSFKAFIGEFLIIIVAGSAF
jgi:hypothetical protein